MSESLQKVDSAFIDEYSKMRWNGTEWEIYMGYPLGHVSLNAELERLNAVIDGLKHQNERLVVSNEKWCEERDAAVADIHNLHTLCMNVGGCCPECGNQIDDLTEAACTFCAKSGVSCWCESEDDENECAAFEWRGAQEGAEHE